MADKNNCWEIKNCGREPGGVNVAELGECPAATDERFNGLNSGKNGGRICWSVAGTMCDGVIQGTFAQKRQKCLTCEIFRRFKKEEFRNFVLRKHV